MICTHGRSGSTLLVDALRSMGIGRPGRHIDINLIQDLTLEGIQSHLESKCKDGIIGVRVEWTYLIRISERANINLSELFHVCLPDAKFIYLTRRDIVHQALSRIKHDMLGRIHPRSESQWKQYKTLESQLKEVPVDAINANIVRTVIASAAWEQFFRCLCVSPMRIEFESLLSDRTAVYESVCEFIGVSAKQDGVEMTRSVHTAVNEAWHATILEKYMRLF